MKKELKTIIIPSSGIRRWGGGVYTLSFVYSKYNGNFLVKGFYGDVKEYLEKNYTHYFVNHSLWFEGTHRDIWSFWLDKFYILEPSRRRLGESKPRYKWVVSNYSFESSHEPIKIYFRRLPKRWIPEFDKLI